MGISRLRRKPKAETPAAEQEVLPVISTASDDDRAIVDAILPKGASITSAERILALVDAVSYCAARDVPGAFAECGVWRGGSVMAMILTLQRLGRDDRDIWLFDTFEGMTEPTQADSSPVDRHALDVWRQHEGTDDRAWPHYFNPDVFNEQMVRDYLLSSGYPEERLHFVAGRVEDTLPAQAPAEIALLRLDTDWYESTRHELVHLYPRLSEGGVLLVDDYGHWAGAKRAVDEYFATEAPPLLLSRIDYTGRIGIKH